MTELTPQTEEATPAPAQVAAKGAGGDMMLDPQAFEHAQRVAKLLSSSQLVPQHLQGKPADCFLALHLAHRLGEDPLLVAQNIVIIQGTAGWRAQWLISRANRSGVFKGRIRFDKSGSGDSLTVTARATMADTGEDVTASASMQMARAEGWTKNPKYQSMPEQMLSYRAASFLVRLYAPEVTLGYSTAEEVEDLAASGRTVAEGAPAAPQSSAGPASATAALDALSSGGDSQRQGASDAPTQQATAPTGQAAPQAGDLDAKGTPYDRRIHSQGGARNRDGSWRRRRGVSDEYVGQVLAEITGAAALGTPASEPTQADTAAQSSPPEEAPDGTVAASEAENTAPDDPGFGFDAETGEAEPPASALSGEPHPGDDSEIVKRLQAGIPQAKAKGDLDALADLEDEVRELSSDAWRQHYQGEIETARQAISGHVS